MNSQNILILPGYYYLFALYADYGLSNAFFSAGEDAARMRTLVQAVREVHVVMAPYRKTWALRLFTERTALARFSPHLINEVLRELHALIQQVGAPPGWEDAQPARQPMGRRPRPPQAVKKDGKRLRLRTRPPQPPPAGAPIVAPPILPGLSA